MKKSLPQMKLSVLKVAVLALAAMILLFLPGLARMLCAAVDESRFLHLVVCGLLGSIAWSAILLMAVEKRFAVSMLLVTSLVGLSVSAGMELLRIFRAESSMSLFLVILIAYSLSFRAVVWMEERIGYSGLLSTGNRSDFEDGD